MYFVYILASRRNGTLYIGCTDNLYRRIWQHREKFVSGFTRDYDVVMLVYYECHLSREAALQREKQMKKWRRGWKLALIEKHNPYWKDLFVEGEVLPLPA